MWQSILLAALAAQDVPVFVEFDSCGFAASPLEGEYIEEEFAKAPNLGRKAINVRKIGSVLDLGSRGKGIACTLIIMQDRGFHYVIGEYDEVMRKIEAASD